MAKFRTSHTRKNRHNLFSSTLRMLLVVAFIIVSMLFLYPTINRWLEEGDPPTTAESDRFYLPSSSIKSIYHKAHYSLAYSELHEQAEWVAYELKIDHLNAPKVARHDYFSDDASIISGSATFYDYKGSGFTKGHLVPAADRAFSKMAMEETFLMSNISPQRYEFNGGVWRELEELVRDWARDHKHLYVITGPVLRPGLTKIGKTGVSVPEYFFKVILSTQIDFEGIAFVIPNEISIEPVSAYARSIDEVEQLTNIDFFDDLLTETVEAEVEGSMDLRQWPVDQRRFDRRIKVWNKR